MKKSVTTKTEPLLARFKSDNLVEIGVDETGRGPFFGPLMAGAVLLPPETDWTDVQRQVFSQLRDSKKISPKKRERLADELRACLVGGCAVGSVSAEEINQRGIQWANREAFRRAIAGLEIEEDIEKQRIRLVIDGTILLDDWKGKQEAVIEGDGKYMAVAGASILAKVEHDRWIQACAQEHPDWEERYDLVRSKGYGTARHRQGIRLYGGCEQHREVFIQRWLPGAGLAHPRAEQRTRQTTTTCLIQFDPPKKRDENNERCDA